MLTGQNMPNMKNSSFQQAFGIKSNPEAATDLIMTKLQELTDTINDVAAISERNADRLIGQECDAELASDGEVACRAGAMGRIEGVIDAAIIAARRVKSIAHRFDQV